MVLRINRVRINRSRPVPCFTGLDAGLPGGDLGLVLVVSASAAATSVLMLG